MKRWAVLGLLAAGVLATVGTGVTMAPVIPPFGWAFDQVSAPLDLDLNKTDLGSKTGEASSECVLGLVAWGDASTQAAARNGGLNVIHHADYKRFNILGIYSKYTTVLCGD